MIETNLVYPANPETVEANTVGPIIPRTKIIDTVIRKKKMLQFEP